MTKFFTVPIRIDALALDQPREVAGPTLAVDRVPWFGSDGDEPPRDHRPQIANVAPAVRNDPLEPNNRFLAAGVHLHWAMPDTLGRGTTRNIDDTAFVERRGLCFPRLPNRWLVTREHGTAIDSAWLVESDYVHPWGQGTDSVPWANELDGAASTTRSSYPFARIGRSTQLLQGTTPTALDPTIASPPLTIVGQNDPEFAALYTACHSIFGLHDAAPSSSAATYSVIGWYSTAALDPLDHWRTLPTGTGDTGADIAEILATVAPGVTPDHIEDLDAARAHARGVRFSERTRWALPPEPINAKTAPSTVLDAEALMLYGTVTVDPTTATPRHGEINATVAVGASAREAVATLLAHDAAVKDPTVDATAFETELEAISFDLEVADHELDHGPKLAEFRHSDGFTPTRAQTLYEIRPKSQAQSDPRDPSTLRQARRNIELPGDIAHQLNELNQAHEHLDDVEEALEWHRQRVFADWQLYMQAMYPVDDDVDFGLDVDMLRDVVLDASLDECAAAEARRDEQRTMVAAAAALVESALARFNRRASHSDQIELTTTAGPRYWRPSDPSIAIHNAGALVPSKRHGDHHHRADDRLECAIVDVELPGYDASKRSLRSLLQQIRKGRTTDFLAAAVNEQDANSWNPLFVEWQSRVRPVMTDSNQRASAGRFEPSVITGNFSLPERRCDLEPTAHGHYGATGTSTQISGRSLISYHGPEIILAGLERYLDGIEREILEITGRRVDITTEIVEIATKRKTTTSTVAQVALGSRRTALAAEDAAHAAHIARLEAIEGHYGALRDDMSDHVSPDDPKNIVTFSLGGFTNRLLMRRIESQLPIGDPLGFAGDKAIAARVAAATAPARRLFTTEIDAPFLPLGIADFHLERGRVIDSFGQFTPWNPVGDPSTGRSAIAAPSMRGPAGDPIVRPRSMQAARLDFRWLSAHHDDVEANDHPASTPLCGWLIPNDFDHNVLVYDASGSLLGLVDEDATWHPAPGDPTAPAGPAQIANAHLAKVVDWLVSRDESHFTQRFLDAADSALRAIEPSGHASFSSRALLAGRPIAVTRVQLNLRLNGPPATDSSRAALHRRIAGQPASDHGFAEVEFPVRLGEHHQFNDGLIGYFVDEGDRHGALFAPQSAKAPTASEHIRIFDETSGEPLNITTSFGAAPIQLTLLLDPRCPVHATTGILPTKSIHLPRDHFEASMNSLQVLVSAMPILTAPDKIELPLPSEAGSSWSWVAMERNTWRVTPATPQVFYDDLAPALPGMVEIKSDGTISELPIGKAPDASLDVRTDASVLWSHLIEHGWIEPTNAPGVADVIRPAPDGIGSRYDPATIERLLSKIARRIEPAERSAGFGSRAVAREGWLRLQPKPTQLPPPLPTRPPSPGPNPVATNRGTT